MLSETLYGPKKIEKKFPSNLSLSPSTATTTTPWDLHVPDTINTEDRTKKKLVIIHIIIDVLGC